MLVRSFKGLSQTNRVDSVIAIEVYVKLVPTFYVCQWRERMHR